MNIEESIATKNFNQTDIVGKHCILELYGCDPLKLNDEKFIKIIVMAASEIAGAKLLQMIIHSFEPKGVTGLALLAESHISIHTWPESKYAAVDVFTCGEQTVPEKACEYLVRELSATKYSLRSFSRQTDIRFISSKRDPILMVSN